MMADATILPNQANPTQFGRPEWQEAPHDVRAADHRRKLAKSAKSSTEHAAEESKPLKKAIGWLRSSDGREATIYEPIPGFEHLFTLAPVVASFETNKQPQANPVAVCNPRRQLSLRNKPSLRPRGPSRRPIQTVRRPSRKPDGDPAVKTAKTHAFRIDDTEGLKKFYTRRCRELTMKPLRGIVTHWVKRLEPQRQGKYGAYLSYAQRKATSKGGNMDAIKPPWWPREVPYIEPAHLQLEQLAPLAVDIMLVHRQIDEQCGKRNRISWISELREDAEYCVKSCPTETFSSSKDSEYNGAMKRRALEEIIPSLFDIARSHEDHMALHGLYEGSGNQNPEHDKQIGSGNQNSEHAKQITWHEIPRPPRARSLKRPLAPISDEFAPEEDTGGETEPEPMAELSPPISSFSSSPQALGHKGDADVETVTEHSPIRYPVQLAPQIHTVSFTQHPTINVSAQMPLPALTKIEKPVQATAASFPGFDPVISQLYLDDRPDDDIKSVPVAGPHTSDICSFEYNEYQSPRYTTHSVSNVPSTFSQRASPNFSFIPRHGAFSGFPPLNAQHLYCHHSPQHCPPPVDIPSYGSWPMCDENYPDSIPSDHPTRSVSHHTIRSLPTDWGTTY